MSTALSIYNKKVFGKKYGILDKPFPAPLLMTSIQFLAQYSMAWLSLQCVVKRSLPPSTLPGATVIISAVPCMIGIRHVHASIPSCHPDPLPRPVTLCSLTSGAFTRLLRSTLPVQLLSGE